MTVKVIIRLNQREYTLICQKRTKQNLKRERGRESR